MERVVRFQLAFDVDSKEDAFFWVECCVAKFPRVHFTESFEPADSDVSILGDL